MHKHTRWTLNKQVTIGHLVSIIFLGSSLFFWSFSIEKRIEQNTQAILYVKESLQESKRFHRELNSKIDRLNERVSTAP